MKKIFALILAFVMLFSFASCGAKPPKPGDVEPSPVEKAQSKTIAGLGITQKDSRIVAFQGENEYLKYVVVYYENGVKTDEVTHMFYFSKGVYEAAKEKMSAKSEVVEINDEKQYISYWSGVAFYGNYEQDLELIGKEYTIK